MSSRIMVLVTAMPAFSALPFLSSVGHWMKASLTAQCPLSKWLELLHHWANPQDDRAGCVIVLTLQKKQRLRGTWLQIHKSTCLWSLPLSSHEHLPCVSFSPPVTGFTPTLMASFELGDIYFLDCTGRDGTLGVCLHLWPPEPCPLGL